MTDLPGDGSSTQFEITAALVVPDATDLDAVLDSIQQLAASLSIAVHVEDVTGDD